MMSPANRESARKSALLYSSVVLSKLRGCFCIEKGGGPT
jgi:hypothetical protein